ncbi:sporulation protein YabP [Sporolactobacillus shoreae]|uniref:Sporulation protein YabP n=1 Tax=Sporolactobacillus shoreae TaxID=1465501 RepID=A0A4Z0GLH3_9BACL|nr:sporulation protein YabP [Sporolactobacillus shoreae]TGA96532.1 sporulation protein YabP [Sporolactobacillus shoreae]
MSQYYPPQALNKDKPVQNHDIVVKNRKTIEITGVKHVESFDHEEFLLETVMGFLAVKGSALKMQNLNVEQGMVAIEGKILEISYLDEPGGDSSKGFFGKLFR